MTEDEAARFLKGRKQNYQAAFAQPAGQAVLEDLAEFCFAYATTFDPDPRVDARKQGRRDVWLRVQEHLKLSAEQLYVIATGGRLPPQPDEDDNG